MHTSLYSRQYFDFTKGLLKRPYAVSKNNYKQSDLCKIIPIMLQLVSFHKNTFQTLWDFSS